MENIKKLNISKSLLLDCKQTVKDFPLAYETYGKLNENKDNAILVFHALTGDQFVTGLNPITKKEGWWGTAVGPGKAIDTDKYFVICANVIGGCMGSWGPKEVNKKTNEPYGLSFPVITIRDIVRAQETLLDYLGVENFSVLRAAQWVECKHFNFVQHFQIEHIQQCQLPVVQVIVHKILHLMN